MLADLVHLDDVLVPDLGGGARLAQEPLAGRRRGRQLRGHYLHRHDPLEHVVERPEDDAEPALAEDFQHLVVPDPAERVGSPGRPEEPEGDLVVVRRALGLAGPRHRHIVRGRARVVDLGSRVVRVADGRPGHEPAGPVAGGQQSLEALAQGRVVATGLGEVGRAVGGGEFQGGGKDGFFAHGPEPRRVRIARK